MTMVTIRAPDGSEQQAVDDSQLDLYPGWTVVADSAPHDDEAVIVNGKWVTPVEVLQRRKWDRVKAIRAEKEEGVAPTPFGDVQIDEKSKAKIMGALDLCKLLEELKQPFATAFTMADNTDVALDNTKVRQLAAAAGQYVDRLYARGRVLRAAINAATSADDLDAIDVEAGWP